MGFRLAKEPYPAVPGPTPAYYYEIAQYSIPLDAGPSDRATL